MSVRGHLGGESSSRSFFGGQNKGRPIALILVAVGTMIATIMFRGVGLGVGLAVAAIVFVVTIPTERGSWMERRRKRVRWKKRLEFDEGRFVPFDQAEWDRLVEELEETKFFHRKKKHALARDLHALRDRPDGADGMGWLDDTPGQPGVAWHAPIGEQPYFSVVWDVSGQLRGIESERKADAAALGWSRLMAEHGQSLSLARGFQPLTCVLPADTARYEQWAADNVDAEVASEVLDSYDDLLHQAQKGSMIQRHFLTIAWPLTGEFKATALRRGEGRDGWRELMREELRAMTRKLSDAGQGSVRPLTAKQVVAVMLNGQNPDRPIDMVADVSSRRMGLPSEATFSEHVVHDEVPEIDAAGVSRRPVEWHHRTAAIRAGSLSTNLRTQWWMLDLLVGLERDIIRRFTFLETVVPHEEALSTARRDVVRDSADISSKKEKGQLADEESGVGLSAAQQRRRDLAPGKGNHGLEWVGYVTVSARSRSELAANCRLIEEVASASAGIERLEWEDSYQSAASGCTWPIFRGMDQPGRSAGTRAMQMLTGKGEKEALS